MFNVRWNKSYVFLDDNGCLSRKENGEIDRKYLNIFQRAFRCLGFYSETHLKKMAPTIKKAVFDSTLSSESRTTIKKLALKLFKQEGKEYQPVLLLDETLDGHDVKCWVFNPCPLSDSSNRPNPHYRVPASRLPQVFESFKELNFLLKIDSGKLNNTIVSIYVNRIPDDSGFIEVTNIHAGLTHAVDIEKDEYLAHITAAFLKTFCFEKDKTVKFADKLTPFKVEGFQSVGSLTFFDSSKWDKLSFILNNPLQYQFDAKISLDVMLDENPDIYSNAELTNPGKY
jgi:hypothetical protein